NVIIGGGSAFAWVNIDGGIFHHNRIHRPNRWTMRILNENPGTAFVQTQNGQFHDNIVVFNHPDDDFSQAVNIGSGTRPDTFRFARNEWLDLSDPSSAGSTPSLPTPEVDGVYGVLDPPDTNEAISWEFSW